ncbi:hypothetical protein ANN_21233 [Periplaneta americana]|uniref:Uncharacterized protein n=1 Tax=Periplaneta americana TaxID=6978 RepID=A0ABQ8SEW1_PERAM|nr:hypothetical protein ANN_21233 [Periplaneta americana]
MSPGSSTEIYRAFARIGLRENPGKNLKQTYLRMDSDGVIVVEYNGRSRRRKRNKEEWACEKKKARNSGKVAQDMFILKYTSQSKPQRTSRAKISGSSRKACANIYFVKTLDGCDQDILSYHPTGFWEDRKSIRRKDTIETPVKYMAIFKEFGTVKSLGSQVAVNDWKSADHEVVKTTGQWHFKLSLCKRIILTKDTKESIIVRGELENHVPVNRAKVNDVSHLLEKHSGDNWGEREELVYYKTLIDGQDDSDEVPEKKMKTLIKEILMKCQIS